MDDELADLRQMIRDAGGPREAVKKTVGLTRNALLGFEDPGWNPTWKTIKAIRAIGKDSSGEAAA